MKKELKIRKFKKGEVEKIGLKAAVKKVKKDIENLESYFHSKQHRRKTNSDLHYMKKFGVYT